MKRSIMLVLMALALAACQTTSTRPSTGPETRDRQVASNIQKASKPRAAPGNIKVPSTKKDSRTEMSVRKLFKVSYRPEGGNVPLDRAHSWKVTVRTASGEPVKGANIMVKGEMPSQGYSLPVDLQVSAETEAGVYMVDEIQFDAPGKWVVKFLIKDSANADRVDFNLTVK